MIIALNAIYLAVNMVFIEVLLIAFLDSEWLDLQGYLFCEKKKKKATFLLWKAEAPSTEMEQVHYSVRIN